MNDAITAIVVGGGIAGAAAAAALAEHPSGPTVRLLEAENQLAQHTTGRSAAQLLDNYGALPVRTLTAASRPSFAGMLSPRPLLTVAIAADAEVIDAELANQVPGPHGARSLTEISVEEALGWFPRLRPETISRALLEPDAADIDVAGVHAAMIRDARAAGATIDTGEALVSATATPGGGWDVVTNSGHYGADLVINCAGAWGDDVARRCSVPVIGLTPMRRTAFMVASPDGDASGGWPLVADARHRWYCKPDGSQFLCSPADETPSEPCDARPEELDVALAIERINAQTTLGIRSVRSAWAGLRTFSSDRSMVIGPEQDHPGFVWCVGQGGTGIQTAPAAGWLTADLAIDGVPGPRFDRMELDLAGLTPQRFRR